MRIISALSFLFILAACNQVSEKGEQGYRENQEDVSKPTDYTQGTDSYNQPQRRD